MNRYPYRLGIQFFGMKNHDILLKDNAAILQKMQEAVKKDDPEEFASAFGEFATAMQEAILKDAQELIGVNDTAILAQRGIRQLTKAENEYFQKLGDAMKSAEPKMALTNLDVVMPETTVDTIFDDLRENHPLLDAIDFQNTGAVTKWLMATSSGVAGWGLLTRTATEELSGAFTEIDLGLFALLAYFPVSKPMLELGPAWLDRFVRTILAESIAVAGEAGYVDGDGNGKPLGMTRALSGATDGVYPRKTAITVNDLSPVTIGTILNTISQGPNSKRRAVPTLGMIVNPADYYSKVFPATTIRRTDGGWNTDVFPYPTTVYISAAVPEGYAIFGLMKGYFAGLGTGKGGKITYSDEYKFLERQRVYLIELYGNGRPKDANAFVLADITGLLPTVQQVFVTNDEENPVGIFQTYDARLASLKIGALTLSPAFNKSVMAYTLSTTDATNTISAVAMDGEATILIKNGATTITNGAAATWATGANTVTVTVTSRTETEVYTIIVTKS